ncbi:MAG: hypothetical protein ACRDPJ_13300 [Nocardioidaceae bacterium]
MTPARDDDALARSVERLRQDFTDRTDVELDTAVLAAWDEAVPPGRTTDPGPSENAARVRLFAPILSC